MDREEILARLHLHAVLPRIGDLVMLDPQARAIAGGWRAKIQLSVFRGPTAHLAFDGGYVAHHRLGAAPPSLGLSFHSCKALNTMFQGGKAVPIPWFGLWRIDLIKGFTQLSERLDHLLKDPDQHRDDPELFPLVVRLMARTAFDGVSVLAEHDPHCASMAARIADGVAVMRIRDTDIAVSMTVRNREFTTSAGEASNPNVILEFKDLDTAYELFQGRLEAMAALGSGDVKITGLIPMFDEMSAIMDVLGRYLG